MSSCHAPAATKAEKKPSAIPKKCSPNKMMKKPEPQAAAAAAVDLLAVDLAHAGLDSIKTITFKQGTLPS
jgi:hypothetical protein